MTYPIGPHLIPAARAGGSNVARARGRAAGVALALVVVACSDGGVPAASPSASAAASGGPSAAPSVGRAPAPRSPEDVAAWRAATGSEDDALAAELAGRVGALDLAAALEEDEATRRTALRALPFADRADQALGALGRALGAGRGDEAAVADTIEGVLRSTRRDVEVLDAAGASACAAALRQVAEGGGRGSLPSARAESLARRVAERAGVAPHPPDSSRP